MTVTPLISLEHITKLQIGCIYATAPNGMFLYLFISLHGALRHMPRS